LLSLFQSECFRITRMNSSYFRWLVPLFLSIVCSSCVQAQGWEVLTSGSDTNLRGVSVAAGAQGERAVWASGSKGMAIVSNDTGKNWKRSSVQGGEDLDFRGVVAFNGSTAYLMSSGEGTKSRIYKTTDGGTTWRLQYSDERTGFFLDAIQCLSETECYALGDPMDGKFVLLRTSDGQHWERLNAEGLQALPQEGAFAASNSCLRVDRNSGINFVTGGPAARMFHSSDEGKTWSVRDLSMAKGKASSGAFSIAVNGKTIVIVGGDYGAPQQGADSIAYSSDAGMSWGRPAVSPAGFRSAVAFVNGRTFVTVGTSGGEFSDDNGAHWRPAESNNLNAVQVRGAEIWAVGANGTVAKFHLPK
jgi:photosystem II stability/assembly factor-like uncharacterized protein